MKMLLTNLNKIPKVFVTQSCEWKSNLFVPKSNDIHFANQQQQQQATDQPEPAPGSSVLYETSNLAAPPPDLSRTMLSTDSKALILALPISMSPTFAGYEPGEFAKD